MGEPWDSMASDEAAVIAAAGRAVTYYLGSSATHVAATMLLSQAQSRIEPKDRGGFERRTVLRGRVMRAALAAALIAAGRTSGEPLIGDRVTCDSSSPHAGTFRVERVDTAQTGVFRFDLVRATMHAMATRDTREVTE